MKRQRPHSSQAMSVLRALSADPSRWRHGYDLCTELDLKSGSLYPILIRLADRGLLESAWEPSDPGRPPRHVYRLTAAGEHEAVALAPADQPARRESSPPAGRRARLGPA